MENSITIKEIEILFEMIIKKLKSDKIDKITFNMDQYWIVLSSEWGDLLSTPELAVGSLSEDVKYLKECLNEGDIYSYSNFDRLSAVLRAISELEAPS